MEGRNELFQRLKPACVTLSQIAVALNGPRGDSQLAVAELKSVRRVLASATSTPSNALDPKLAEYVFFPIAQLLKASQRLSIACLELCLECIAILVDKGWQQHIPSALAAQLLILCTLLAEKRPKGLSFSESTDELQAWSFWCMYYLFSVASTDTDANALLRSESNFPQLGQTISVILDGIQGSASTETQVAALKALIVLIENVTDVEIQASFLPGIVSKLSRVLTPQTGRRRNHIVLTGCLSVLQSLLINTMSDAYILGAYGEAADRRRSNDTSDRKSTITEEWRQSAAIQMKPVLNSILGLKSHDREDVRDAIASLAVAILQHCGKSLESCLPMILDALVTLVAQRPSSRAPRDLQMLVQIEDSINNLLQSRLFDWLQSLPTLSQSPDAAVRVARLEQIVTAYALLKDSQTNMHTIDRTLATSLQDSVVATSLLPATNNELLLETSQIQSIDIHLAENSNGMTEFSSPIVQHRGHEEYFGLIEKLIKLASGSKSSNCAGNVMRHLRQSQNHSRVACFWLALTAVRSLSQNQHSIDDLLNVEDTAALNTSLLMEELYSYSLTVLNGPADEAQDPRVQSLALQGLALRSEEAGRDFRFELVDALYPVLHTLASPDAQVQRDSIATLNILSTTCGYSSVEKLIVENVDYLTNAVALKLNAFDISPQAPQVLLMMVRLAGPSLLPYLEDTVESIFVALENYHGYPLLVELLFQVLSAVAEEGARTPQLAITSDIHEKAADTANEWRPISVDSLHALLRRRGEQRNREFDGERESLEKHPEMPWKDLLANESSKPARPENEGENDITPMEDVKPALPVPKTYSLLLKINELTQHFLPASSPSLRSKLLNTIRTTIPAIASHEDSFLPLVNTLWPEIVSRLDDEEQYVVVSALEVISQMCQYAGDFMRTRVTQLWPRLKEIYESTADSILLSVTSHKATISTSWTQDNVMARANQLEQAVSRIQASPSTYADTSAQLVWTSLISMLTTIVRYVRLTPEMFDELLEMVEPVLESPEVRPNLEAENADAVWLRDVKKGTMATQKAPVVPSETPWSFALVPS